MPPQRRRGPYKQYLRDPTVELPKTTRWLRQKQERDKNEQQRDENIPIAVEEQAIEPDETQYIDMETSVSDGSNEQDSADTNSVVSSQNETHVSADGGDDQDSADTNPAVASPNEAHVQHCEETNPIAVSDSSDDSDNESDTSSVLSYASEQHVDQQRNEMIVETSEDEDNDDDRNTSENEEDLHFGERGNLLHPDVMDWQEWNNLENQHGPRQPARQPARQPLYPGAQISQEESDILIMSFIIRWGLEDKGIEHLLRLLDCHMPTAVLGSKYLFLKKFETGPSMKMRYFCHQCSDMLPPENEDGNTECECGFEGNVKELRKDVNCFVHIPISQQIEKIVGNGDLMGQMRKECPESDVVSGNVYKRLREMGAIGDDDITLQWNTDGVKPFKSSKVTIYPIQACINELKPFARRDNMMLCGLYYGNTKPDMDVILRPFVDELSTLHREGINCYVAGRGERLVKVHTLLAPVDSVARAPLQGLMQFNGQYGCSFCLMPGERIERGRGFARVYIGELAAPRSSTQHRLALRNLENYNATHNRPKIHVKGVKRASVLLLLPVFNIIKSFSPDYLHAALEGTVVTFYKHWCNSEYDGELWHLSKAKRRVLNERLEAIMPPVEVTRPPRTLEDIALWKASEMKSFLLYYSLPCLKNLLPNRYLKHWLLFVYSMTVFLREKNSRDDFDKAQVAIDKFVGNIRVLYPNCHSLYTFNTHLLLHFPKAVKDFGGLWASSTFPYEHFNGVLTRLINGTQSVPMQICRSFARLRHVSHMSSKIFSRDDSSHLGKALHNSMLSKYGSVHSLLYSDSLRLFGSPEMYDLSLVEKIAVERLLNRGIENTAKCYRRMILCGTVYHSSVYGTLSVRNNSIAKMNDGLLVSISRIVLVKVSNSLEVFCVIICELLQSYNEDICRDNGLDISSSHIVHMCRRSQRIVSCIPQNIDCKCVGVPYGNAMCVIPLVNSTERD